MRFNILFQLPTASAIFEWVLYRSQNDPNQLQCRNIFYLTDPNNRVIRFVFDRYSEYLCK